VRIGDRVRIADLATIGEQTKVGELTVIGRGVSVESQVSIGTRCTIETGAYITAQSTLGNFCFVASKVSFTNDRYGTRKQDVVRRQEVGGAPVAAGVTMWDGARVGANATVLPGVVIGADAVVGAGSVVIRDVAPRMVVMGAPARAVRMVTPEQLLAHLSTALETGGGA
jgi:UDP-2-acetamido-3-amino-2,3-dideoxy-glucuronate N-acetyltransferase